MCTNRDSLLEIFLFLIELILKIIVVEAVERKLTLTSINEVFFSHRPNGSAAGYRLVLLALISSSYLGKNLHSLLASLPNWSRHKAARI